MQIDPQSGEVLACEPPPDDFAVAARRAQEGRKSERKDAFESALRAEKGREEELDDLFRKASKKQDEKNDQGDGEAPGHAMDDRWR
ncbi:MAG: hypothetical protein MK209_04460 [Planctomycetes bacterium]|nr:hypothetical protein [Planctomycetota bacterium]